MQLGLTDDDAQLLREVLATVLADLRSEIVDTDNPVYRRMLKARRERLRAVLVRLGEPVAGPRDEQAG